MEKEEVQVDYEVDEDENQQQKTNEAKDLKPATLYIDGFIRPFTMEEVKQLVSRTVSPINLDEHFFMNVAKTFCYVTYPSMEAARKAKEVIEETKFPESFGNKLRVRFTSIMASTMKKDQKSASDDQPADKRQKVDTVVVLEDLFRKTEARPVIYYKPLTEAEVELRGIDHA
ncbi:hypothetical protein JH06_0297 [Blastocystis sp. subtype 4]|uniref:hypothetical protein n=1 Tax=Blastocystis sp. subtype 4 TaxID=944170 RepID=UPI000711CA4E|nr:hypothetical protein JH06_0297 [Blastocystis sp. subtype 4]KNB46170.1 hypothetical protein JH06_0297 [Blastocystis sp. subtype 4]|eukprot:XP_014529613.1 hypothetical protein JH06_0297 [Blastocystis sp. subtype 4]